MGTLLQESEPMPNGKYFILFFNHNTTPNEQNVDTVLKSGLMSDGKRL